MKRAAGGAAALLLIGIAVLRVLATYAVFNQTFDEPLHLACGMEWLSSHRYTYEVLHPPLARVAIALGPYLSGLRSFGKTSMLDEGNALLAARGEYWHNLALARAAILPFFILGSIAVAGLGRRLYGPLGGTVALAMFTFSPTVLAHSGFATTDMPFTGTLLFACYCALRWIEKPGLIPLLIAALAFSLCILTKFSALLFLPLCVVAIVGLSVSDTTTRRKLIDAWRWQHLVLAVGVALFVIWGGYRFALTTPRRLVEIPIPALDFFRGIRSTLERVRQTADDDAYSLGVVGHGGHWYYFPLALAVKTELPFLLLFLAGGWAMFRRSTATREWRKLIPLACWCLIIGSAMATSRLNIGVRHILPAYGFMALAAGALSSFAFEQKRWPVVLTVIALIVSDAALSAAAHPDYLAYFNLLAGRHPEHVLVDSDLDWGQDLGRLQKVLARERATEVAFEYFGTADADVLGLPPHRKLGCSQTSGWIAISITQLVVERDCYRWLDAYQPVETVGRSIRLYRIEEPRDQRGR